MVGLSCDAACHGLIASFHNNVSVCASLFCLFLESRLKKMKAPATTSSSRSSARSMLSSLEAVRKDHMNNFMSQDGSNTVSGAVVSSYAPGNEDHADLNEDAEHPNSSDLGCCTCCFPVYKLLFPERISVSRTERRRLVDSDELQLRHDLADDDVSSASE